MVGEGEDGVEMFIVGLLSEGKEILSVCILGGRRRLEINKY